MPYKVFCCYFRPKFIAVLSANDIKWHIPNCSIYDRPQFGYRGLMLDVSRHFFPVSFVKKYIDLLALHKMNTLHWHLTDDQGWRIEIKKYPKLTEVGSKRKESMEVGISPTNVSTENLTVGFTRKNKFRMK
ncbi:MAG: family 20 glycosylhydrolase [Emticicia sp.]|nr:family 20 glycosylhydrolase [Emticicia sp.]